jgi:hypothetical protein
MAAPRFLPYVFMAECSFKHRGNFTLRRNGENAEGVVKKGVN